MKETGMIKIEKRDVVNSRTSKQLRQKGYLPGNVYGKGIESMSLIVKEDELKKRLAEFGKNSLYSLVLEGKEVYTVIIKDIQNAPVKGNPIHVDFQQISLTEEINAEVGIRIIGKEHLELKKLLLIRQIDTIPVRGLPQNIPDSIQIDVSNLNAGDSINVGSIKFPKGIIPEIELDHVVISVNESMTYDTEEETGTGTGTETETQSES